MPRLLTFTSFKGGLILVEVWKDIKGYEGLYQVSNLGRVRSLDRHIKRVSKRGAVIYQFHKGRVLSPKTTKSGYLEVQLFDSNSNGKMWRVHRLVAKTFIPCTDSTLEVNHIDENKLNNEVENLEWCNRQYNTNYGTRNQKIGIANIYRAKISSKDIEKMKSLRDNGIRVREIAQMFDISTNYTYDLLSGRKGCGLS